MQEEQHTIKAPVTVSGIGLHTGEMANMTFKPAKINHGIKFKRIDLEGQPVCDADVDNVVDLSRGTTIEQNGARINTVEHTLAALTGLDIDNAMIEIDGPEPPIMDGSSIQFIEAIQSVGLENQGVRRNFFELSESVFFKDDNNNIEIAGLPLNDYRLTVMVDYDTHVLGSQHASLNDMSLFTQEIASSRTFCFLHELEMLRKANLIRGGNFNNAIVLVDKVLDEQQLSDLAKLFDLPKVEVKKEGILNNIELRHTNEPARHKLLDLIGDLTLIGRPIKGQILAARPGHASNVAFAKKVKRLIEKESKCNKKKIPTYDSAAPAILDINQIAQVLPHAYPFLLIDKVTELENNVVTGIKNVTFNEPFFQGHFPKNPIMPGVLQIEAMAQMGGILLLNTVDNPSDYWTYFIGMESVKFRKMVIPGDTLILRCELLAPIRRGIAKLKGQAYVGDKLACEGIMSASLVRKDL